MKAPKIAVISFPGNNCEVESLRALRKAGMEAVFFRWNEDRAKLKDVDGYFIPGGFSYEDRGRSGMVAARDPLMEFIGQEAEKGKVVIGNCNGAQILVESGLIPLGKGLQMSLARNAIEADAGWQATGFLSEWIWMTPSCARDRCATSDWEGSMQLPIAHGEGRFTTKDKDLFEELKKNDQIAFSYCDAEGNVSNDSVITPNGSMYAIAGICNLAGNVVAIMPHPERTPNGDTYFQSLKKWIQREVPSAEWSRAKQDLSDKSSSIPARQPRKLEIFIDMLITNNEERTVEKAARRYVSELRLKQWKYLAPDCKEPKEILSDLSIFNKNKERAFVRRGNKLFHWDANAKAERPADEHANVLSGIVLLRKDIPDTGARSLGMESETGIAYQCNEIDEQKICSSQVREVLANPHGSTLERLC